VADPLESDNLARSTIDLVRKLRETAPRSFVPPSEGTRSASDAILPSAMVRRTPGYITRVVNQINGCYEKGWLDGCAVMMRRLIETLIIECFEKYKIADHIKDPRTKEFLFLADLIDRTLQETAWNLGRTNKKALPKLKSLGDQSAHNRRYNAHREDIDRLATDFRNVCQELLYLAGLR
jgi:hypothetical protein